MTADYNQIYQFKITLRDIRPPIWRRIQVPENYTFWDLHVAIQDAMGWLDFHLHAFRVKNPATGETEEIGIPDDDGGFPADPKVKVGWEVKILDYFSSENSKASYTYDFGDGWEHRLKLEKMLPRDTALTYPVCTAGKRACPPEDCGGPAGYYNLLDILADRTHAKYRETLDWLGGDFDSERFDPRDIQFDNPRERWEYVFEGNEDPDEEPSQDLDQAVMREMRFASRQEMYELWQKAKANDIEDLEPEPFRLAKIMQAHETEFANQFEFADLTYDHEYDPDREVNPFLHIYIHSVAETQLDTADPIEVTQFYNAMRRKKCSHHDALHLIGAVLAPLLYEVLLSVREFDLETYRALLRKYKTRNPEKIANLLENEPLLND
jgi:Plasmid pRiA4b ORF-3-like protein/Domain of unknown function (DUF1841)